MRLFAQYSIRKVAQSLCLFLLLFCMGVLALLSTTRAYAQSGANEITFVLIDADLDEPIAGFDPIPPNSVLDLDTLPLNLNIAALANGLSIASVVFDTEETENFSTDNFGPFTLAGDTNGNYFGWTPTPGENTITAVGYAAANGEGELIADGVLRFTAISSAENLPPNVDIEADAVLTLPSNSAILNGQARDPDGDNENLTILWTLQDAPEGADIPPMAGTGSTSLLLEELVAGTYRFRLNVLDEAGSGSFAEAFVYVYPELDQAPIVDAGDSVELSLPKRAGALFGTAYDDGKIVKYEWIQLDGPMDAIMNGRTTSALQVSNMRRTGHYWFQLTVTDDIGQTAVDTTSISINPDPNNLSPNIAVSADITMTFPMNSAELNGTFQDPDGALDFLEWYKISGPSATITPTSGFTTTVSDLTPGTYIFRLNGFDNSGNVGFDTVKVLVNPEPNDPPIISMPSDLRLAFPQTSATLNATATDIDGTVESWIWTQSSGLKGGNLWDPDTATLGLTDLPIGAHEFRVTAIDDDGAQAEGYVTVTVVNDIVPVQPIINGEFVKWHPLTLSFEGPTASETDIDPNPFLDFRMQVVFTAPSGREISIPGFFNGDGKGGGSGNQWALRFAADEVGEWQYQVQFSAGKYIAVDLDFENGTLAGMHGSQGSFSIADLDQSAPGFLRVGRLEATGEHYLKHADGGYWIKGGVHSPENWLAFAGFDNTVDQGNFGGGMTNGVHRFDAHADAWQDGDPNWTGLNEYGETGAAGLIGALNYLAEQHVNSIYVVPMNLGGTGRDSYPFISAENSPVAKTQYDISKLEQWNYLFEHAQRLGIQVQISLTDGSRENLNWLDDGALDIERKLFYRELVARFGYSLGIKWTLAEDFSGSLESLRETTEYLEQLDWADHPKSLHLASENTGMYGPIMADQALSEMLDVTSAQYPVVTDELAVSQKSDTRTEGLRLESDRSGKRWVIDMDQNNPIDVGLTPDNIDQLRKHVLYNVLFSGGNLEWYMGASIANLELENFEPYQAMWEQMWYARRFLTENTPFDEMQPGDGLLTYGRADGQVFYKADALYAVYLPDGQAGGENALLNLSAETRTFSKRWYNPRTGRFQGPEKSVRSGEIASLGNPPDEENEDWVVLLIAQDQSAPTAVALDMVNSDEDSYYLTLALACLAMMLLARWSIFRPKATTVAAEPEEQKSEQ